MVKEKTDVPPFPDEGISGERLYRIRPDIYVQYNGKMEIPEILEQYLKMSGGEYPPYMPLPEIPVQFTIKEGLGKTRTIRWKGKGKIHEAVLNYVTRNGTLPSYTRGITIDLS